MDNLKQIVGGMFGFDSVTPEKNQLPAFLTGNNLKLFNGRSCIYVLTDLIKPRKVWMPSYLCHAMTDAVLKAGGTLQFYPINEQLRVDSLDWVTSVKKNDLVVFIDYMGFDLHRNAMAAVQEKNATILQDASHSMLSGFSRPFADYILFSPRKCVATPGGGILISRTDIDVSSVQLIEPDHESYYSKIEAFIKRSLFDSDLKTPWFETYQASEQKQSCGYHRMDDLSSAILSQGIDYQFVAEQRRNNFHFLLSRLNDTSLFKELPDDVVPLGFPVVLERRDHVRDKLAQKNIFCPVHWEIETITPKEFDKSHTLSRKILTIPSDQRYTDETLRDICSYLGSAR